MKNEREHRAKSAERKRRPSSKDRVPRVTRVKPQRAKAPKPRRLLPILPSGQIPCLSCGVCCSYVAVEIDGPETLRGATDILWYLYHPGVSVFVDEGEWMVQFETRCRHQLPDHRCGIYENRPPICREYEETSCEVNVGVPGHTMYSVREYLDYVKAHHTRIYRLIERRGYLPADERLDAPPADRAPALPFRTRYEALRERRARHFAKAR